MLDEKIKRINYLYNKSKTEDLSKQEQEEQKALRAEYAKTFREGFKKRLDNIDITYDNGKTLPLSNFKKL